MSFPPSVRKPLQSVQFAQKAWKTCFPARIARWTSGGQGGLINLRLRPASGGYGIGVGRRHSMMLLSTLSLPGVLAAGTGNQAPIIIFAIVVIGLAAVASAISLKKS
jgi:hypothetical protein